MPSSATAVVLNVTVVGPSAATVVRAYPVPASGSAVPGISNVNVPPGTDVANLVTVTVGRGGAVRLHNLAGTVDLLADVAGYYSPTGAGAFVPLEPYRALDTREGLGARSGRIPAAGWVDVTLASEVAGRVPAGAQAAVLTVTGVSPQANAFVAAYPTPGAGSARPDVSTVNLPAGDVRPNQAVVPLGAGGKVRVFASASTDVVVDVSGYYAADGALGFRGLSPVRVLDTRNGTGAPAGPLAAGASLDLPIAGGPVVPAGARAVVLNVTGVEPADATPVQVYPRPSGDERPGTSNLNLPAGGIRAGHVIVGTGVGGAVRLRSYSAPLHLVADVSGWFGP